MFKVQRSAESLLGIINDILDFSTIEVGKLDMERIEFNLGDVMETLANLVGLKAEDKGLELLFEQPTDLPTHLVGDPLRLGQVLVNLGNNAVKFTERGEVIFRAEVAHRDASSVRLRFTVRDTGVGMSADQLRRLFQPFPQAEASTSRRYGGTGLGLAISRHLVELMEGEIGAHSEPGRGSTFHFTARFGLGSAGSMAVVVETPPLPAARVLVVDDNASARQILVEMARAIGLECARQLQDMRGMEGSPTAPTVLMLTAFGREEALQQLGAKGVEVRAVLTKPVTPSTLFNTCALALGHTRVADRAALRDEQLQTHHSRLQGVRVLLVEDNQINQELAVELLRSAQMQVTVARDGRQALALLEQQAFDLVLMDCQMPVMDGFEATRTLRAQPRWKALPVIAMTANTMVGDREKVLAAGMNDHIAKPIDVDEMFATIARWAGRAASFTLRPQYRGAGPAV